MVNPKKFKNILLVKKLFLIGKSLSVEFMKIWYLFVYQLIANIECPDSKVNKAVCCGVLPSICHGVIRPPGIVCAINEKIYIYMTP